MPAALVLLALAAAPNAGVDALTQAALTMQGDVAAGRALYSSAAMQCTKCHRNDDDELPGRSTSDIGPNLTAIGNKFDRPHLIDSLLHPSKEIGYGYRPQVLRLDDGRTLTGLVRNRTDESLTLIDAAAKSQTVAVAAIEAEKPSEVSLMPAGLIDPLSPSQFADLVAYLESRRPGNNGSFGSGTAGPIRVADGWSVDIVATGLDGATALETLDDGRILVAEQTGRVRVIENGTLLPEPLVELDVEVNWERGVVGLTVDPDFPAEPYVYITHVKETPYSHHRVSRFTVADGGRGNTVVPGSETVLLEGDDQSQYKAQVIAGHQGGGTHFGPDGCLYVGIGEHTAGQPAQQLDAFLGKIVRINRDGSIPSDNPLLDRTEGKYGAIWAYGCRNPFTFAFRDDGLMLINDVGGKFEEINRGTPGGNFGWPTVDHGPRDGSADAAADPYERPVHWYPQASVSGGDFAPPAAGGLAGKYVFADFVHGWVRAMDPDNPPAGQQNDTEKLAAGLRRPCDLRFGPDGALYVLLRNAWIVDDKFVSDTGSVVRLTPPGIGTPSGEGDAPVSLDEDAVDPTHGFEVVRIVTPAATYDLEKRGGGLSRVVDRDGNDWIGFDPTPGTGESGEYRGWPNAVYRPPTPGLFHPQNVNTATMQATVLKDDDDVVSIEMRSDDGWTGRYDFTPEQVVFTMVDVPEGGRYWCLYEGTPGGTLDAGDRWIVDGESHPVTERHDADLPEANGREEIAFRDSATGRTLRLTHESADRHRDTYYPMGDIAAGTAMTVFGFGREGIDRNLTRPATFTLRLEEPATEVADAVTN